MRIYTADTLDDLVSDWTEMRLMQISLEAAINHQTYRTNAASHMRDAINDALQAAAVAIGAGMADLDDRIGVLAP